MPPRPKNNKRRSAVAAAADWFEAFESEFDFFGDLDGKVELDGYGRPSREAVRAAWTLYGEAFLAAFAAKYPRGAHFTPWALVEFGMPGRRQATIVDRL